MPVVTHKFRRSIGRLTITSCALAALLWVSLSGVSSAHRVTIFAWVDGDTVHTESKTGGGKSVKGASVSVLGDDGNPLLTDKTDDGGRFSFRVPQKTDLTVVLKAAMGHKAQWKIPAGELPPISERSDIPVADQSQPETVGKYQHPSGDVAKNRSEGSEGLSRREMEKLIDEALDRKLKPLITHLSESAHDGPRVTDVVGGIGYIFGLVGLVFYILSRNDRRSR